MDARFKKLARVNVAVPSQVSQALTQAAEEQGVKVTELVCNMVHDNLSARQAGRGRPPKGIQMVDKDVLASIQTIPEIG